MRSPAVWWTIAVVLLSLWLVALLSGVSLGLVVHVPLLLAIAALTIHSIRANGAAQAPAQWRRW